MLDPDRGADVVVFCFTVRTIDWSILSTPRLARFDKRRIRRSALHLLEINSESRRAYIEHPGVEPGTVGVF